MAGFKNSTVLGYLAGITTGVTYGLNPLFAVPLMKDGVAVDSILFFRYFLSVLLLGGWMLIRRDSFKISEKQALRLVILGALFATSSLCLFEAYKYIPSGLATTIIFLYPVLVAIIMVFMRVYPTWQVWLSIAVTFAGVVVLCGHDESVEFQWTGVLLAGASALAYAMFIVVINRSRAIRPLSNTLLTFYALAVGAIIFFIHSISGGHSVVENISGWGAWLNLLGLAVLPTIVSTATLAMATRIIGATKASVMGVFEPVTAILVGALAFGEQITMNVVVGIALTIGAVTFMILSQKQPKHKVS